MSSFSYHEAAKPNRARRLYHDVVDEIGMRIARGDYPAGEVLPGEEVLAAELGVSRTVLREATKVLTEKGLVQPRPKVGTLIHPRTQWNWLDADVLNWEIAAGQMHVLLRKVTEARRIIEPEVAALAAQRATPEALQQLAEAYQGMERNTDNIDVYIAADLAFHGTIMDACDNQVLAQMADTMRRALIASREVTLKVPGSSVHALPLHRAVLEAIQQRDPRAAHEAMQHLIDQARSDIERSLAHNDGKQDEAWTAHNNSSTR